MSVASSRSGAVGAAIPLWFLANYTIDTALAPLMFTALRRNRVATMSALFGSFLVVEFLHVVLHVPFVEHLNWVLGWLMFQLIGFLWRDGALPTGRRLLAGAGRLWALAVAMVAFGPWSSSMIHVSGQPLSPTHPPSIALVVFGLAADGDRDRGGTCDHPLARALTTHLVARDRRQRGLDVGVPVALHRSGGRLGAAPRRRACSRRRRSDRRRGGYRSCRCSCSPSCSSSPIVAAVASGRAPGPARRASRLARSDVDRGAARAAVVDLDQAVVCGERRRRWWPVRSACSSSGRYRASAGSPRRR